MSHHPRHLASSALRPQLPSITESGKETTRSEKRDVRNTVKREGSNVTIHNSNNNLKFGGGCDLAVAKQQAMGESANDRSLECPKLLQNAFDVTELVPSIASKSAMAKPEQTTLAHVIGVTRYPPTLGKRPIPDSKLTFVFDAASAADAVPFHVSHNESSNSASDESEEDEHPVAGAVASMSHTRVELPDVWAELTQTDPAAFSRHPELVGYRKVEPADSRCLGTLEAVGLGRMPTETSWDTNLSIQRLKDLECFFSNYKDLWMMAIARFPGGWYIEMREHLLKGLTTENFYRGFDSILECYGMGKNDWSREMLTLQIKRDEKEADYFLRGYEVYRYGWDFQGESSLVSVWVKRLPLQRQKAYKTERRIKGLLQAAKWLGY